MLHTLKIWLRKDHTWRHLHFFADVIIYSPSTVHLIIILKNACSLFFEKYFKNQYTCNSYFKRDKAKKPPLPHSKQDRACEDNVRLEWDNIVGL
jgi:hypothetical protein